jgi:hypothetical protein
VAYTEDDQSASTAQFKAFTTSEGGEQPAAWEMRAPRSRVWTLVGIVVAVAVVVAIVATMMIG